MTEPVDYERLKSDTERFIAREQLRKSRMKFESLGSCCPDCGEQIEYHENPERFVVCEHIAEQLRRASEDVSRHRLQDGFPFVHDIYGIRLDIKREKCS